MTLLDYLTHWDPMGFIAELGAPKDEYSLEAATIRSRYKTEMSSKQVGLLVYAVFVELIELNPAGFKQDAVKRGPQIKKILDDHEDSNNDLIRQKDEQKYIDQSVGIINSFPSFAAAIHADASVDLEPAGQFRIIVSQNDKQVVIDHAWGDTTRSFQKPTIITVFFADKKTNESYVIYMTESELKFFPEFLKDCQKLAKAFLEDKYEVRNNKHLLFFRQKVLAFPKETFYNVATPTKRHRTIVI